MSSSSTTKSRLVEPGKKGPFPMRDSKTYSRAKQRQRDKLDRIIREKVIEQNAARREVHRG